MSTEVYYFSTTGNSMAVARDIAGKTNGKVVSIPSVMDKESIKTDAEVIGIVFPVYYASLGGSGILLIVGRFVRKLEDIGSKYIFAVCTHRGHLPRRLKIWVRLSSLAAANSTDPDEDILHYRWDFDNDGAWDTGWLEAATANHTWSDDFAGSVTLEVSDGELTDTATAPVNITNAKPTISEITASLDPTIVGTTINANATFNDPGTNDTHTAVWNWGDNTTSEGYIDDITGSVSGSHTYTGASVYTIRLTITDDDNGSDEYIFRYVVVYDPEGGFVTGGGWINSPEGAYASDPTLSGKANLGFISKYQQGQSTPSGNTQFHFKVGDLKFQSTEYEWLVVTNHKAMYKGSGTINGGGDYGFIITVIDAELTPSAEIDLFRIKIWDKVTGDVIYDNQMGSDDDADPATELGGGSIVIHSE